MQKKREDKNRFLILIIDDEVATIEPLKFIFEREGYRTATALSGEEGLEVIRNEPVAVCVVDYKMPKMSGLEFLRACEKLSPDTVVVMMTAFGDIEVAVTAMKEGAYDYLTKPLTKAVIVQTVERAIEKYRLLSENARLKEEIARLAGSGDAPLIIGDSQPMKTLGDLIAQVASSDASVLITGESGTGKELIARTVHKLSGRKEKNMVTVNCAALPETIIESELFGYEKGAFTGANARRIGYFENAHETTLFIDEVSEMPLTVQTRFLRFLQENEIQRLGGSETIKINARVVAATSRDLKKLSAEGKFREDLFYRLNVVPIFIPPLRERREDIPLLAAHFIEKYTKGSNYPARRLSESALGALLTYDWPGNVRELENVCHRTIVLSHNEEITTADLPVEIVGARPSEPLAGKTVTLPLGMPLDKVEELLIRETLFYTGGDKQLTAQILGINRRTIYRKLKQYEEQPEDEDNY